MVLRLYDTLAREKRDFVPRDPKRVTMYVCGPTVYDFAHIGNARPAVVFDVLYRLLRHTFGEGAVIYARNITDVDDKINARAASEGVPIGRITARYEAAYLEDMGKLGVLAPTLAPHVTDHMDAIIAQIGAIMEQGCAYAAEGHVLFDVSAYENYGRLSRRNLDDMIAGARVEVAPYKKNPHDFVLWKPSKAHEPSWPSPWGEGRPGWHIECSAMIEENLGLPIDIHGGGIDLVFPHHENEIAQGVCAHGHSAPDAYARYWMHNGFLTIEQDKMSKSVGNVLLLHDLVAQVPGEVVRWALLSAHYRQPLDWSAGLITQSKSALDRLYGALRRSAGMGGEADPALLAPVLEAARDDLNTPGAMAGLFAMASELERALNAGDQARAGVARASLCAAGELLGLLQDDPETWFRGGADEALAEQVEALIAARKQAKLARDFAEADRIRDELTSMNIEVMDGPQGTTWRIRD
ncbi:MAG: cysteine--tRNA ligase [Brevundimonas sp.]|uniref:cysteine--tRNA ligase n=1 Tax=Brevundimonas sp. TaxID=1871086 RepID=UPI00391CF1D4